MEKTALQNQEFISRYSYERLNHWFIRLRWIAALVALVLIYLSVYYYHYLVPTTFPYLISLVGLLIVSNIVYTYFLNKKIFYSYLREIQIVIDLIFLTLMLHFSGGLENPLSFLYIFHIILSGILLERHKCYIVVLISFALYSGLALAELSHLIPHYTLNIFPHTDEPRQILHTAHYPLYVWSMIILQFFIMSLTAYFITNIMEHLRQEERQTREERQKLDQVLQSTGAGLVIFNTSLEPIWYNEPVSTWFGLNASSKASLKKELQKLLGGTDGEAAQTLKDGQHRVFERERINANGEQRFYQFTLAPLKDREGQIYQVVALIQDITEKKIMEAEMIHAAKMVTLGTMSAGIAHEVGNPLASLSTRLHLMSQNPSPEFLQQSITLLKKEIARIERIVRGISQIGRPSKEERGPCDVNQVLAETIELLKYHKLAKHCKIEYEFDAQMPMTMAIRDQLKQVFLNIGLNALEAMAGKGTLTIRSEYNKGTIRVHFIDTGKGMDETIAKKIFQPFFTTKENGSG
ncbi:MAG: PAS domain-containing protein, partial [candidate division KSB1 bacterium]|nr:PAS domain-containing protein [candidate division KSB1 bacterium]